MDQRRGLGALAHPQRADPLGPVDLVRRDRDQIRALAGIATRPSPWTASHSISAPASCAMSRDLGDRLDHADLVVDQHHRDQQHALVELALEQSSRSSSPSRPDRQDRQVDAPPRQPFAGVEHCRMLGRDRDDPVAALGRLLDRALERPVERFGRAAGEGDAAAVQADRLLDLLARDLDRGCRLVAPARRRMRVGELLLDPRAHRLRHFGRDRRRRLIVEVDHAALAGGTLGDPPPFGEEAVDVGLARAGPEADPEEAAGDFLGATPIAASTALPFIAAG